MSQSLEGSRFVSLEDLQAQLKEPDKEIHVLEPDMGYITVSHYLSEYPKNPSDLLRYHGTVTIGVAPRTTIDPEDVETQNQLAVRLTTLPHRPKRAYISNPYQGDDQYLFFAGSELLGKIGEDEYRLTSTHKPEDSILGNYMRAASIFKNTTIIDVARIEVKLFPQLAIAEAFMKRLATHDRTILPDFVQAGYGLHDHIKLPIELTKSK